MSRPITETVEAIDALIGLFKGISERRKDGKLSVVDIASLTAHNFASVVKAASGVDQIPGEIKDLQPEEVDFVVAHVMSHHGWPDDPVSREIVAAVLNLLRSGVQVYRAVEARMSPPKAEVVPE